MLGFFGRELCLLSIALGDGGIALGDGSVALLDDALVLATLLFESDAKLGQGLANFVDLAFLGLGAFASFECFASFLVDGLAKIEERSIFFVNGFVEIENLSIPRKGIAGARRCQRQLPAQRFVVGPKLSELAGVVVNRGRLCKRRGRCCSRCGRLCNRRGRLCSSEGRGCVAGGRGDGRWNGIGGIVIRCGLDFDTVVVAAIDFDVGDAPLRLQVIGCRRCGNGSAGGGKPESFTDAVVVAFFARAQTVVDHLGDDAVRRCIAVAWLLERARAHGAVCGDIELELATGRHRVGDTREDGFIIFAGRAHDSRRVIQGHVGAWECRNRGAFDFFLFVLVLDFNVGDHEVIDIELDGAVLGGRHGFGFRLGRRRSSRGGRSRCRSRCRSARRRSRRARQGIEKLHRRGDGGRLRGKVVDGAVEVVRIRFDLDAEVVVRRRLAKAQELVEGAEDFCRRHGPFVDVLVRVDPELAVTLEARGRNAARR